MKCYKNELKEQQMIEKAIGWIKVYGCDYLYDFEGDRAFIQDSFWDAFKQAIKEE